MVAGIIGAGIGLASSAISAFGHDDVRDNWALNHPIETAVFQGTLQNNLQKDLMAKQFEYNKYFTEHGHQAEVSDLRKAGLNPILSANNGAYSQVGLGQAQVPDIMQGASAKQQAKLQAQMNKMSMLDILSNIEQKSANSALQREQAKTESFRGANVAMDTDLKASQIALNNINTEIGRVTKDLKDYENLTKEQRFELEQRRVKLEEDKVKILHWQAQISSKAQSSAQALNESQIKLNKVNEEYTRKVKDKGKSIQAGGFGINFGYSN